MSARWWGCCLLLTVVLVSSRLTESRGVLGPSRLAGSALSARGGASGACSRVAGEGDGRAAPPRARPAAPQENRGGPSSERIFFSDRCVAPHSDVGPLTPLCDRSAAVEPQQRKRKRAKSKVADEKGGSQPAAASAAAASPPPVSQAWGGGGGASAAAQGDKLHQLEVDAAVTDDDSVVALSEDRLEALGLFKGDVVKLKGKKHRNTVCVVMSDEFLADGQMRLSKVARSNLRVRTGDTVSVEAAPDVKYGKAIHVLPFEDTLPSTGPGGESLSLHDRVLQPYFRDNFRPLHQGDTFTVRSGAHEVEVRRPPFWLAVFPRTPR